MALSVGIVIIVTLIAGLLLQLMPWALAILAFFSNLTAVQRLWHVRQMTSKRD